MNKQLDINSQTKIGEMLETYPQLEEVLLKLSPSFAKLKNPILRKTIGRIASIRQVAEIGNIPIGEMVSILRRHVGIVDETPTDTGIYNTTEITRPEWVKANNISITFDASSIIESGGNPMKDILSRTEKLGSNEGMLLIAPFKPVPMIELLVSKNYCFWCEEHENKTYTYLRKNNKND